MKTVAEHSKFLLKTEVKDLQCAWLLLLYCGAARAYFYFSTVRRELSEEFSQRHDEQIRRCFCTIAGVAAEAPSPSSRAVTSLPFAGLGLRSATRLRHVAHWASWADTIWRWHDPDIALLKSQGGPLASAPFVSFPTSRATRLEPQVLEVLFLCRLRLPLPLTARVCRCGRLLDVFGHHRSACVVAGVLGGRGVPLETAAARICREAGGRVRTNVFVRDLDLGVVNQFDTRRFEVVVDGLPLFQGAQVAVDTTLVCPLTRTGEAKPRTVNECGASLKVARRRKERRYPELLGDRGRAQLVVLAGEVGGRFSAKTAQFLTGLASAKVRELPVLLRGRAHAAWLRRWSAMLACAAAARAFALSLLEMDTSGGVDGPTPSECRPARPVRCEGQCSF